MERKRNTRNFAELSRLSAKHLKGGMMTEYVNDLRQMAKILKHEGRSIDELKVLILGFYIKLNCGETIPAIDRELVSSIRKASAAAGASKYDVEELLLSTIHEDTAPRRNFTPRDSLYVLELCMSGDWEQAESIAVRSRAAVSYL